MSHFSHVEIIGKRRHVSRTAKTPGSSDMSRDYNQVMPRKTHKWNMEEQITLILLVERYENNWTEKKKIFNSYIQDELNSSHHFTEGALRSMYRELKFKFNGSFGNWCCVRKALEQKAILLCIPLVDHVEPSSDRLISSKNIYRRTKFPRLGFRAFDISNQGINSSTEFRAGCFVDSNISVPPNPHSYAYRNDARRQIERIHEGVTPFISTTSSLLRVLSSAHSRKYPSSIALIDLHKAGKVEQYEDNDNPYLQNVYRLNLKPEDSYRGTSEFLIYGEIKADAILSVVTLTQLISRLSSLSSNDDPFGFRYLQPSEPLRESSQCLCESSICLCKSSKRLRDVRSILRKNVLPTTFSTGQIVGKLLKALDMPTEYLNEGISIITKDWYIRGWQNNKAFKNGISNGFHEDHAIRLPDLNLLKCSRLKSDLEAAANNVHEDFIHATSEEMCWSSDTIIENSSIIQESLEFSFDEFLQELRNVVEISTPTRA